MKIVVRNLISRLMYFRYPILCILVFAVMCFHTVNGQWVGDFWEHSAVARELATHMLHPGHPQLLLDAPHAFYSPYALAVAILVRWLNLDVITALSVMGLINLVLFFLGLRLFIFSIAPKHGNATAFYALLLTLCWWGNTPWRYSGFFHFDVLGFILPYPSTCAAALTLIALGLNRLRIEGKRRILLVPLFLIAVTVLISHPLTFLFLAVGLICLSHDPETSLLARFVPVGILLSLALLAAAFWPYFPVLKLLFSESGIYHESNREMYEHVLSSIWPSLIAVPLIIAGIKEHRRQPVVLMLLILTSLYVFGLISERYAYGRAISCVVLLLHIVMAQHLVRLESRLDSHASHRLRTLIVPVVVLGAAVLLARTPLTDVLARAAPEQTPTYKQYLFLSGLTNQYDVVLSDIRSSWLVPTFGGKIVAAIHPLAFVPDQHVRRSDVDRFFSREATFGDRRQIIQKYNVNYLLLNKLIDGGWRELQEAFTPRHGEVVFESESFVLLALIPDRAYHREE